MPAARSRRSRTHSRADGAPLSSTRAGTGSAYGAQPRQHPVQEERSGRMLIPRPAVSPLTGARMPTLRRNTVVLGSGTHSGPIRGAQSAEAGAGRCSGQERVWGQRRVPHSDARRVVGGIGDRGCCTTMPISPNPGAPGYAWRRFSFLEKGLLDRVECVSLGEPLRSSDLCRRGQPRTPGR